MKKKHNILLILFALCAVLLVPAATEAAALNDSDRASAQALAFNQNYSLKYKGWRNPIDVYQFTLDKNGIFGVKVVKAPNDDGTYYSHYLIIYDASGNEILAFVNDELETGEASLLAGLPAGTYYMKTFPVSNTAFGKSYSYQCSFEATENAEREKNDTKETATVIGLDTEYTGYHGGETKLTNYEDDKYDVYKVTLTKDYTYQVTNTNAELTCLLLTNEKAIDDTTGIGCNANYVAPYTGDYYVVVYNSYIRPQSTYNLMVKTISTEEKKDPDKDPDKDSDKNPNKDSDTDKDPDVAEDENVNYNPQISPKKTKITSLKSSKKAITIKWKKVSCNGYIIQYGTKKSFKGAKKKIITSGKKTKLTIKKLKKGKKYYVRIRAYKVQQGTKYYSKWSGKKSIKVK